MKRIQDLPLGDRPREKLRNKGAQALSDLELLAVVIGSGTRHCDVISLAGKMLLVLDRSGMVPDIDDLQAIEGVGAAKAGLIAAALEFARRRIRPRGIKITFPPDAYPLIRQSQNKACITMP